jgi:hypothetical protein
MAIVLILTGEQIHQCWQPCNQIPRCGFVEWRAVALCSLINRACAILWHATALLHYMRLTLLICDNLNNLCPLDHTFIDEFVITALALIIVRSGPLSLSVPPFRCSLRSSITLLNATWWMISTAEKDCIRKVIWASAIMERLKFQSLTWLVTAIGVVIIPSVLSGSTPAAATIVTGTLIAADCNKILIRRRWRSADALFPKQVIVVRLCKSSRVIIKPVA